MKPLNNKNKMMNRRLELIVYVGIISTIFFAYSCKKATIPTINTVEITAITINSASSGGNITSDGGDDIVGKGICWNTTGDPSIADSKTNDGKGSGSFSSTLSSLQSGTTYYVRAYATNSAGTGYGEELTFNTKIADIDGNQYFIVKIGTQVWMAENLKTTKYTDNTQIPNVTGNSAWATLTTPGYCWYNNDLAYNKPLYGALYNWHAVKTAKLCPTGWHVPTDGDFKTLELSIGLPQAQLDTWGWRGTDQGVKLKNTTGWNAGENGTNTSGFSALPGGYRYYENGTFSGQNILTYWWSATESDATNAWYRRVDGNNNGIYKAATDKRAGKSVRCVKN